MASAKTVELSEQQSGLIARALADPRRYEILKQIGRCAETCACVELRASQEITPATLSHHMRELELAGLVEVVREGKTVEYGIRRDVLQAYMNHLAKI